MATMTDPDLRKIAAFHEAGHCAAALHLGMTLNYAAARRNGGGNTCVTAEHGLHDRLVFALAGQAAQREAARRGVFESLPENVLAIQWENDAAEVARLLRFVNAKENARPHEHVEVIRAERDAAALVSKHWRAVVAIGDKLKILGRLSGETAREIFEHHRRM